ncbi:hypothetical protein OGATHE_001856 [Ogataea polymorpha]|uniref:Uncharacterized protein n=1 Tax=Ogataea polymorpha TaxID=460523 RepID=A0A9P8TCA2_9ASCO|nr:hypothetical protein OGATHE_001856 [Ogataea polymorpha]
MVSCLHGEGLANDGDWKKQPSKGERPPLVWMLPWQRQPVVDGPEPDLRAAVLVLYLEHPVVKATVGVSDDEVENDKFFDLPL